MLEISSGAERRPEEPTLSDEDLSIFLGRALQEDRLLDVLDLRNCNRADFNRLTRMVVQEIVLRTPQRGAEETLLSLAFEFGKAELLTGQMKLADRDLTSRQLGTLLRIKEQLDHENNERIEKIATEAHESFMRTLSERSEGQAAFLKIVEAEFGERGTRLSCLVHFDDSNTEPTMDSWGIMAVSLEDGQDVAMNFVRQHADEALQISGELKAKDGNILHDQEAAAHNFRISTTSSLIFAHKKITPGQVFARAQEIKSALIEQGGCGAEKYPNLFEELRIHLSDKTSFGFSGGSLSVNVDTREPLAENVETIRYAAGDGNPKSIREFFDIETEPGDPSEEREKEDDKEWLIYALQKERGGEGIEHYKWDYFISVGDEDIPPSQETWGHMVIDKNADDEATRTFILGNIETTRSIVADIRQTADTFERACDGLGFLFSAIPHSVSVRRDMSPATLFAKEEVVIDRLTAMGGFLEQGGRSLQVCIGEENSVNQYTTSEASGDGGIVIITCRADSSPDEIVSYILEQAQEKGFQLRNPSVVLDPR